MSKIKPKKFHTCSCISIICSNSYFSCSNVWIFCLIRSENGDLHFKTWLFYSVQFIEQCVLGNFNSHVFKFFFYLLHKYFWGGSILHISTEIWIKEWSVFDGFGTTCCYCLCLNNSLLNHCTMGRGGVETKVNKRTCYWVWNLWDKILACIKKDPSCFRKHLEQCFLRPDLKFFLEFQKNFDSP